MKKNSKETDQFKQEATNWGEGDASPAQSPTSPSQRYQGGSLNVKFRPFDPLKNNDPKDEFIQVGGYAPEESKSWISGLLSKFSCICCCFQKTDISNVSDPDGVDPLTQKKY